MNITAYHVSNTSDLTIIQPHLCNSVKRDELALNLKAACFTTTLFSGELPTISPYPRDYNADMPSYRYTMTFDPKHFFKFQMAKTTVDGVTQVHYLLLRTNDQVETNLAGFIRACALSLEDFEWNDYFPGGRANEYTTHKTFVNVLFVHEVPVTWTGMVNKIGGGINPGQATNTTLWYERMLQKARRTERLVEVAAWIEQMVQQPAGNHADRIQNHEDDQGTKTDNAMNNITMRLKQTDLG